MYYINGGAFEEPSSATSLGLLANDTLLAKSGSGTTLNYANIKTKKGLNLYLKKTAATDTSGKRARTGNSGLTAWDTAKKALVVKYKAINTKFEEWWKKPEAYTNITGTGGAK